MKNRFLFILVMVGIGLVSCKKSPSQKELEEAKKQAEKPISVDLFQALYEKDTINLTVNNLKENKVNGHMEMKLFGQPAKIGDIKGKYHGDTLFVDYTFVLENDKKAQFRNPMALLRKEGQLILGSGKIETYLGRSFFSKSSPIEFEKVKYKFSKLEAKDK